MSPNIYTHHDNAIRVNLGLKATVANVLLKPRIKFSTSPGRDNSMYNLSDLSNLK